MSTSEKTTAADRRHGGSGSSHQDASKPLAEEGDGPSPGSPTNGPQTHVSGGGGERNSHHTHDAKDKDGKSEAAVRSH